MRRGNAVAVGALAAWLVVATSLVFVAVHRDPVGRAVIGMGAGLIVLWVFGGGALMYRWRAAVRRRVLAWRWDWRLKFVLLATALALIEEAVTVTMTNLAPLFGVPVGRAYITASANYWDVVGLHSVVVFVPLFVGWAWLLSRYDFRPAAVFWLFGVTGTLCECSFGLQHLTEFGLWIFVYGLMVYLPAYCTPPERGARPPRPWHYVLAVFAPFIFELLVPTALVVHWLAPHHPTVHFPPLHSR